MSFNGIDTVEEIIERYQIAAAQEKFALKQRKDLKQAAVLMPIVQREHGVNLLLTTRAQHLKNHAGQVSFPGGRFDETDDSLEFTAIRETHEEVGIAPELIEIIGPTHQHQTISHYWMTGFLGVVDNSYVANICEDEVEDAFEVPLLPLLNPQTFQTNRVKVKGVTHVYYSTKQEGRMIWGATAKLLRDFALSLSQN